MKTTYLLGNHDGPLGHIQEALHHVLVNADVRLAPRIHLGQVPRSRLPFAVTGEKKKNRQRRVHDILCSPSASQKGEQNKGYSKWKEMLTSLTRTENLAKKLLYSTLS
jgi:hypothetical protein